MVLSTDLGRADAARIVDQIELVRALLLKAMFDRPVETPERIEVVAFATQDELTEFTRSPMAVGFFARDPIGRQRIAIAGGLREQQSAVIAHELAHLLSAHFLYRQPRWFVEGVATYFETVGRPRDDGRRAAGTFPQEGILLTLAEGPVPVREVLTWAAADHARLYAMSWLLVHYLMNNHGKRFTEYQRRLARVEDPRAAWNEIFPEWSLDSPLGSEALDVALEAHMRDRTWRYLSLQIPARSWRIVERPLTPPEVHTLRLELPRQAAADPAQLQAEVDEALREDPGHVAALAVGASRDPLLAPAIARRAIAAHPNVPRAWELLGRSLRGADAGPEREAALRRAVELAPARPEALVALSQEILASGRPDEALTMSRRAVEVAPWSPVALFTYADVLLRLGRCADALLAIHRGLDVIRDQMPPETAAELTQEASRIEQRCSDPRAGTR